jgi:hypothetical protein
MTASDTSTALSRLIAERNLGPATTGPWGPLATPIHLDPPIPDSGGPPWRENAFVSWWDVDRHSYGIGQFSTTPNGDGSRARFSVAAGGRTHEVIEPVAWGTMSSASISVDLEATVRVAHPDLQVELDQEPLVAPIDFTTTKAVPGLADDVFPLHHYQQPVRTRGHAVVAGETHHFEGLGWRDRTWGFRDESISWTDYSVVCAVIDEEAILLYKVIDETGTLRASAWRVDRDGQHDLGDFRFIRNAKGLLAEASVETPDGTLTMTVTGALGGFWNPLGGDRQSGPTCSVYDEFVALRIGDGRTASALCEHGIVRRVN